MYSFSRGEECNGTYLVLYWIYRYLCGSICRYPVSVWSLATLSTPSIGLCGHYCHTVSGTSTSHRPSSNGGVQTYFTYERLTYVSATTAQVHSTRSATSALLYTQSRIRRLLTDTFTAITQLLHWFLEVVRFVPVCN